MKAFDEEIFEIMQAQYSETWLNFQKTNNCQLIY